MRKLCNCNAKIVTKARLDKRTGQKVVYDICSRCGKKTPSNLPYKAYLERHKFSYRLGDRPRLAQALQKIK